jgi:hypothetical protein
MAFPTVAARTTTAEASSSQVHSVALGSPNAGDLLVVIVGSGSAGDAYLIDEVASGRGWFEITAASSSSLRLHTYAKIALGGGNDVLTLRTVFSMRVAAVCYQITGHGSYVGGGASATATSTNADPPNASISGSAQDVLFLAAMVSLNSVASAAPSSYGTLTTLTISGAFLSSAERALNATSDNPGTFTNTSQQWIATSIAIPELAITTNARQTQEAVETITGSSSTNVARLTQIAAETISHISTNAGRITQVIVEMVSTNVPNDSTAQPIMILIAT